VIDLGFFPNFILAPDTTPVQKFSPQIGVELWQRIIQEKGGTGCWCATRGPLDGGQEGLPDGELPADQGATYIVAVRDQGPPVLRAGIWGSYDGRQHVYAWLPYRDNLLRYEGSQELDSALG
jgi:hypothetical protein